jgi:hypothetical protein
MAMPLSASNPHSAVAWTMLSFASLGSRGRLVIWYVNHNCADAARENA